MEPETLIENFQLKSNEMKINYEAKKVDRAGKYCIHAPEVRNTGNLQNYCHGII